MILGASTISTAIILSMKKKLRTLLIDDMRTLDVTRIVKTFDEGIRELQFGGPWDILYLDHDLGEPDPKKTGYGVMCWLEENTEFLPKEIKLVTSNPVGRKQMEVVLSRVYAKN